ncbi:ribonuclease HII [Acinetobacter puyangensis]|uniref:ribonuclease HII n=1 Tax=Acinetobacter puyangensis TaxID=1096779 RepID=UPI003A4DB2B5
MLIAGVDEAGRGPLIGSVVTAAVILDPNNPIEGLNDSKKLSAKKREKLFLEIQEKALAWSIAEATHEEIDSINILQATMLAMKRAVEALKITPDLVRIDGNRCPDLSLNCEAVIGGDALHAEISAASILAKVTRDRQMQALDQLYPDYGFARHNGYPTKAHLDAIQQHGVLIQHRRSYKPVRLILEQLETLKVETA